MQTWDLLIVFALRRAVILTAGGRRLFLEIDELADPAIRCHLLTTTFVYTLCPICDGMIAASVFLFAKGERNGLHPIRSGSRTPAGGRRSLDDFGDATPPTSAAEASLHDQSEVNDPDLARFEYVRGVTPDESGLG